MTIDNLPKYKKLWGVRELRSRTIGISHPGAGLAVRLASGLLLGHKFPRGTRVEKHLDPGGNGFSLHLIYPIKFRLGIPNVCAMHIVHFNELPDLLAIRMSLSLAYASALGDFPSFSSVFRFFAYCIMYGLIVFPCSIAVSVFLDMEDFFASKYFKLMVISAGLWSAFCAAHHKWVCCSDPASQQIDFQHLALDALVSSLLRDHGVNADQVH